MYGLLSKKTLTLKSYTYSHVRANKDSPVYVRRQRAYYLSIPFKDNSWQKIITKQGKQKKRNFNMRNEEFKMEGQVWSTLIPTSI